MWPSDLFLNADHSVLGVSRCLHLCSECCGISNFFYWIVKCSCRHLQKDLLLIYWQTTVELLFKYILIKVLLVLFLIFDKKETIERCSEMTSKALVVNFSDYSYLSSSRKSANINWMWTRLRKKMKYFMETRDHFNLDFVLFFILKCVSEDFDEIWRF